MAGFKNGLIKASYTPYSTLCGGIASPGLLQEIAPDTSAKVLTSNGQGAKATYETPITTPTDADWTEVTSGSLPSASSLAITSGLGTAYEDYFITVNAGSISASNSSINIELSDDGGSTYGVTMQGSGVTGVTTVGNPNELDGTEMNFGNTNGLQPSETWQISFYITGNKTNDWKMIYASMSGAFISNNDCALWMALATSTNDIDAIRLSVISSGNFDAGTYYIGGK